MTFSSVSILICTKDRAEHLKGTLASLARVTIPSGLDVELIVVDNNSEDETAAVARQHEGPFHSSRVVHEERVGVSVARNRAIEEAEGDLLLFTDDDVRVPENWISGMTRPIREGDADAVAGGVQIPSHLERPWMKPWHRSYLASSRALERMSKPLTDMVGANMCLGRHVFSEIPGFDVKLGTGGHYGYCEESLLAYQLHEADYHIGSAFDVVVEHHFDPSRLSRAFFLSVARRLGRSMAYIHHSYRPERSSFPEGGLRPYLELMELRAKLFVKRVLRRPSRRTDGPPVPAWENYYVHRIAYLKQGLRERA